MASKQRDFAQLTAAARPHHLALLNRLLPDGRLYGWEYKARNPRRADKRVGSFSFNIQTGAWADFATGDTGGDIIALAAYVLNCRNQAEAYDIIAEMIGYA